MHSSAVVLVAVTTVVVAITSLACGATVNATAAVNTTANISEANEIGGNENETIFKKADDEWFKTKFDKWERDYIAEMNRLYRIPANESFESSLKNAEKMLQRFSSFSVRFNEMVDAAKTHAEALASNINKLTSLERRELSNKLMKMSQKSKHNLNSWNDIFTKGQAAAANKTSATVKTPPTTTLV